MLCEFSTAGSGSGYLYKLGLGTFIEQIGEIWDYVVPMPTLKDLPAKDFQIIGNDHI
jgi:hypothetical protein